MKNYSYKIYDVGYLFGIIQYSNTIWIDTEEKRTREKDAYWS